MRWQLFMLFNGTNSVNIASVASKSKDDKLPEKVGGMYKVVLLVVGATDFMAQLSVNICNNCVILCTVIFFFFSYQGE